MRLVGLMSGTSADAIDAALVAVEAGRDCPSGGVGATVRVEAFFETPWPEPMRRRIHAAAADRAPASEIARLRVDLAAGFAEATTALLRGAGVPAEAVAAVACHGQTVAHHPAEATLQLLDPATLAARTGIPCISDFRGADVAAGGEGAPLVAWPDRILFAHPSRDRAIVNIGGMANVTRVPAGGNGEALAFDLGPGNVLLDLAAEAATAGAERWDADGGRAARGRVDEALLAELLRHPWFDRPPPRSTGRETFGPALLDDLASRRELRPGDDSSGWEDLLATLTAFTARSIAEGLRRWIVPLGVDEILVAGGGTANPQLMRVLDEAVAPIPVSADPALLGVDPAAREAVAFALLGWAFLTGRPGNLPEATGAESPAILGSWTPAPGRPHPDFRTPPVAAPPA